MCFVDNPCLRKVGTHSKGFLTHWIHYCSSETNLNHFSEQIQIIVWNKWPPFFLMQSHLQFVLIAPTTAFVTLWSIQWLAFDIAFDSWKWHFDDDNNDDDGDDDDDGNNHGDDDDGFWKPGSCSQLGHNHRLIDPGGRLQRRQVITTKIINSGWSSWWSLIKDTNDHDDHEMMLIQVPNDPDDNCNQARHDAAYYDAKKWYVFARFIGEFCAKWLSGWWWGLSVHNLTTSP